MEPLSNDRTLQPPALLREIIELVPLALFAVDRRGTVVLANAGAVSLFGIPAPELIGKPVEILIPPAARHLHAALQAQLADGPESQGPPDAQRAVFGLRADGAPLLAEIALQPLRADGELFVVATVTDISEREPLDTRHRRAVESAATAMVMSDGDGRVTLVNTEAERLFGYSRDELLNQPIETLLPRRFQGVHQRWRQDFGTHPSVRSRDARRELSARTKDGREIPVEVGLVPVDTVDGPSVISAVVDVSERTRQRLHEAQMTEALRRSNEALERSDTDLRQFAFAASHDLQTSLRGLTGCAQILQRRFAAQLGELGNELVGRIVESATQLRTTIEDLVECSRVEARAHPFAPVSLAEVLRDVAALLERPMAETHAAVTSTALPTVMGDRALLTQLLRSLIDNSLTYRADAPPAVHVDARRADDMWTITVADNGIGIEPEHHDSVFEPFRRLHTQRAYPGTGMGLALCRRVVHHHGGRIWIESGAGPGTVVKFTLHAVAEPPHD